MKTIQSFKRTFLLMAMLSAAISLNTFIFSFDGMTLGLFTALFAVGNFLLYKKAP